jgi:hypothetical protein
LRQAQVLPLPAGDEADAAHLDEMAEPRFDLATARRGEEIFDLDLLAVGMTVEAKVLAVRRKSSSSSGIPRSAILIAGDGTARFCEGTTATTASCPMA